MPKGTPEQRSTQPEVYREVRRHFGMTQARFAAAIGVKFVSLQRYERRGGPACHRLAMLAVAQRDKRWLPFELMLELQRPLESLHEPKQLELTG